uniref:Putative secreted protein n=1 Tax=Ixodes ricinus TaxID=34613 RepID=A0A6B0TXU7_IXORI
MSAHCLFFFFFFFFLAFCVRRGLHRVYCAPLPVSFGCAFLSRVASHWSSLVVFPPLTVQFSIASIEVVCRC